MHTTSARAAGSGVAAVRDFRPGDEAAILAAMLAALERGECDGMERYQAEHAIERLVADPRSCAVAEVEGRFAGWVIPADDDLTVVPEFRRRGVGRELLEAGRRIVASGGRDRLRLWVPRRTGAEAFATACGMRYTSSLWLMRLAGGALAAAAEPIFPSGTAIRPLHAGVDEAPFVALVNRVFLDHPSPIELSADQVRSAHASPGFDASHVLVVEDTATDAMVGFCRVHPFTAADGTPSGEIRLLGVDREWRGRGLGRAVTAWGIADLRRRGARTVQLAVEGENESALRLYNRLGFRFAVEWPHWTVSAASAGR